MSIMKNKIQNPERSTPAPEQVFTHISRMLGNSLRGDKAPVNVLGQLLNSEKVANLFLPYWAKSKEEMSLSHRQQEIIILRSACIFGCEYVWGHHVPVAKQAGMNDDEILQIRLAIAEISLTEAEKVLLEVTDQVYESANISDELWDRVNCYYKTAQVLDMITVMSQYIVFNAVNNIYGIRLENSTMPALGEV